MCKKFCQYLHYELYSIIFNITDETQCPHVIPRGELNATCGRNYGEICNYSCIEGTIAINTSRTIICGANALWNIPLDTICTGKHINIESVLLSFIVAHEF